MKQPDNLIEKAAERYKTGRFQAALRGYSEQFDRDPHCSFEAKLYAALTAAEEHDAQASDDGPKRKR